MFGASHSTHVSRQATLPAQIITEAAKVYGVSHSNRISRIDVVTREDALEFIAAEENRAHAQRGGTGEDGEEEEDEGGAAEGEQDMADADGASDGGNGNADGGE